MCIIYMYDIIFLLYLNIGISIFSYKLTLSGIKKYICDFALNFDYMSTILFISISIKCKHWVILLKL